MELELKTGITDEMSELYKALELFCANPGREALSSLIYFYQAALKKQLLNPDSQKVETARSVWYDLVRRIAAYRVARMRSISSRPHLWTLEVLFLMAASNPWCNYSMTFGLDCNNCPLSEAGGIKFNSLPLLTGVNCYSKCALANPEYLTMRKAFTNRDFYLFRKTVQKQVFKNSSVNVWEVFKKKVEKHRRYS